jgi:hypothetical protein
VQHKVDGGWVHFTLAYLIWLSCRPRGLELKSLAVDVMVGMVKCRDIPSNPLPRDAPIMSQLLGSGPRLRFDFGQHGTKK